MSGKRKKFDTDTWLTPNHIVQPIYKLWRAINLDPFYNKKSCVKAKRYFDLGKGENAYELPWEDKTFANGPYSGRHPKLTAEKCAAEAKLKHRVINLAPAAPGSKYWRDFVWNDAAAIAWLGRLAFVAPEDVYDAEGTLVARAGEEVAGNRTEIALIDYEQDPSRFKKLFQAEGYPVSEIYDNTWGAPERAVNPEPTINFPELYVDVRVPEELLVLKTRLLR